MKLGSIIGAAAGLIPGVGLIDSLTGGGISDLFSTGPEQLSGPGMDSTSTMFDGIPSWLTSAAGSLAGTALNAAPGAIGQIEAQNFNAQQAQIARDFNAQQAQTQRDFADYEAGNAVQRRVLDLKAAGLNPMLAYTGAAAAPSGSAASGPAASTTGNIALAGSQYLQSASAARNLDIDSQLKKAAIEKTNAETVQTYSSAGQLDAQRDNIRQEMNSFALRMERLGYETTSAAYQTGTDFARAKTATAESNAADQYFAARAREIKNKADILGVEYTPAFEKALFFQKYGQRALKFEYAPKTLSHALGAGVYSSNPNYPGADNPGGTP